MLIVGGFEDPNGWTSVTDDVYLFNVLTGLLQAISAQFAFLRLSQSQKRTYFLSLKKVKCQ